MVAGKRNFFFGQFDIGVTAFPSKQQIEIPFRATRIIITFDSGQADLEFSFQKNATPTNLDGILFSSDNPIVFDQLGESRIWFRKGSAGGPNITGRVWAWRGAG